MAIVHDYLTQRGGAERVVLSMLKAFPDAPIYTAVHAAETTFPEFAEHDVRTLWTNRLGALRRDHRIGLPLYGKAFSGLQVEADVVLCSSSGFAHGVKVRGRKVVYCYTPARWLYDQADTYLAGFPGPVSTALRAAGPAMRRWDRRAAATADLYLTSSTVVRARIRDVYGIDATILPPPASPSVCGPRRPVPGIEPGFVLCVSRLMSYKNVASVLEAFDLIPGHRLVVVGDGPERRRLADAAGTNVALLGVVDDAELAWLYSACVGVVTPSYEDFGLAPIEAASCGKPVAALRSGGFLDTVLEGETGVFFDEPEGPSIAKALLLLTGRGWDSELMAQHAERFTQAAFARRLVDLLETEGTTASAAVALPVG